MSWKSVPILLLVTLIAYPIALAGSKEVFTYWDDPPADAGLYEGDVWCSEGETMWANPFTPYCPAGGTLKVRNIETYSCFTAWDEMGNLIPELSGTGWYTINGNFDLDYTGPVFGKAMIVPSPDCDLSYLDDPESWFEGKWNGVRTVACDGDECTWTGTFKVVAKGHGGEIDGVQFRAEETFTAFTPLPIPWDLIPDFPMTGPEGVGEGFIF